jgi:aspartyl-tRNA(Asn)/glutamyl-tRNA(Gln) amidotransferase subunit C
MSKSQTITKAVVSKTFNLGRIGKDLPEDVLNKFTDQLGSIVGYVDQLQSVDTTGITSTDIIARISIDQLREDEPEKDQQSASRIRQNIINNFPNKQGNLLLLPLRIVD